jgi:DNA polymerase-3 subunit epsilon
LYAIIDIETTGQAYGTGKITEIAIFIHNGFEVTDSFSSLINPECNIPGFITNLTGISNQMVTNAPRFFEIARKIVELTQDKVFVAHNVSFDYRFIQEEFKRLGYDYQRKTMCTVKMGRRFLPGYKSYSLGKLCDELGISIHGRHRAAGDALATVKLFEMILARKSLKESKQAPNQLRLF